jgi:hypothetical protein
MLEDSAYVRAVIGNVEADIGDLFWNSNAFSFRGLEKIVASADDRLGAIAVQPIADGVGWSRLPQSQYRDRVQAAFALRLSIAMSGFPLMACSIG